MKSIKEVINSLWFKKFFRRLGIRFGSLESEKIIIGSLKSEKIGP